MNFIDVEINKAICMRYLIGVLCLVIIFILLSAYEMLIPKRFNRDVKISDSDEYVVNIESLNSSRIKLSISGYAFKGPDAIERYNSYYILKNNQTGKMYKLKTKMEQRGNFKGTGVEFSGMHSQAITFFMKKGTYTLFIWYDNNDENILLKTDTQVQI